MKLSWDDAPPWAQWLAMDENGKWWWYENEPYHKDNGLEWLTTCGKYEAAYITHRRSWRKTLEERPT